jgi:hypothetical protein
VRIGEEDSSKTSFWTRYSQYDFVVVPFGMTNVPTIFMCLMKVVFKD